MEPVVPTAKVLGVLATLVAGLLNPGDPTLNEMKRVNAQWNHLKNIDDETAHGQKVYWATPKETISAGGGNAVDKAVGKMFELVSKGYDEKSIKLAITFPPQKPSSAVVLVDYKGKTYVLDDQSTKITELGSRPDLQIGYRINRYQFEMDNLTLVRQDPSGVKNFRSLLERMKADGSLKGKLFPDLAPISTAQTPKDDLEVDATYVKATNKPLQ